MPSVYAHYRFGNQLLATMPGDIRRTVQRFRQLFDMGLHGPDIFFYASPLVKTEAAFLGIKYHELTGEDLFTRVCRSLRLQPSEAANSYLYGLLCHYCLDSQCHPYVRQAAVTGEISHAALETELERYFLEADGKIPAIGQDLSRHISLTAGECETVARFYPPAEARDVKNAVRSMAFYTKLFATPEGPRRTLIEKGVGLAGKNFKEMLIPAQKPAKTDFWLPGLVDCWEQALQVFPEMLNQLQAHMTYNAPLGKEFEDAFG